jgi:hypothetical protein
MVILGKTPLSIIFPTTLISDAITRASTRRDGGAQSSIFERSELVDIAPVVEHVDVQGTSVSVHGVSAKALACLLGRYPELRILMPARRCSPLSFWQLAEKQWPPSSRPAADNRATRPPKMSRASSRLALRLTSWPPFYSAKGYWPFVDKLTGLGGILNTDDAPSATEPASKLRKPRDARIGANYPPADVWAMTPR